MILKIFLLILITINLNLVRNQIRAEISKKNLTGLTKLFNKIFVQDDYNNMVRPNNDNDITKIETELKLLQIDLVFKFNFLKGLAKQAKSSFFLLLQMK
jgi:hypothetical protein